MSNRNGDWIQTYSGLRFWPLDPRPDEINIKDIAHALSLQCRFGGHCSRFYSVAEHSLHVSRICNPADALWGLLHDAAEAYLIDLPRPIKRSMPIYSEIESVLMEAIKVKFGLIGDEPENVRHADNVMLATERVALFAHALVWQPLPPPLPGPLYPLSSERAKHAFIERFIELTESQPSPLPPGAGERETSD